VAKGSSTGKTLTVAFLLCIVCSVVVSAAAVMLRPVQTENRELNVKENILRAAGMIEPGSSKAEVEERFASITPKLVELETGRFIEPSEIGLKSIEEFQQQKVATREGTSYTLSQAEDIAGLGRVEKYAKVYLAEENGEINRVIVPVRGYGLWSTLYGFMALENDANTIAGFGFYEHGETPGLGGEVDNPAWKAQWSGKEVYGEDGEVAIRLIKGGANPSAPGAEHHIDSLSGATLTSRGIENLIQYWLGDSGLKPFLERIKNGEIRNV
tara:strand:+ start:5652 stop:6458 length:807 start_codon:yes stop_codon:yes gene_type:complete